MNNTKNVQLVDEKSLLCIVGLGYVGLPLAVEFAKKYDVIGFDIDSGRIDELKGHIDRNDEVSPDELRSASRLTFIGDINDAAKANVYIITVPTPVDRNNSPDFSRLIHASELVSSVLENSNIVIYESTVYPGATEDVCVPILEKVSKLSLNKQFFVGYSPERINPGDNKKSIRDVVKITSGSTPEIASIVDKLYQSIITAGTYSASSIQVAEAAKVIENIQRDVNIALFNELAMLFDKIDLESKEVFDAAASKWNFITFEPGLVGGHCIGVDPYYLTHKAKEVGFNPEMILAGRNVNTLVPSFVANKLVEKLALDPSIKMPYKVLILGATFKENCKDIRNSKSFDLRERLIELGAEVDISDRVADTSEVERLHGFKLHELGTEEKYDGIIIALKHDYIVQTKITDIRRLGSPRCIVYDLKSIFSKDQVDLAL